MGKYLIIDGNNMSCRMAFAQEGLTSNGNSTSVHFGFMSSLVTLKKKFNDHVFLIVWDGKSKRRMKESEEGVKQGIIKTTYKANRKRDEVPQELLHMYEQLPFLHRAIHELGISQIRLDEFEADDVVSAYCKKIKDEAEEIVCLTSDKDYYQTLNEKVSVYDSMKDKFITEKTFKDEYGIEPKQHVDCGAISGDFSDNIHGIPGWGAVGALKAIQKHGSWENFYKALHAEYDVFRVQYPDLNEADFDKLANIRSEKEEIKFKNGEASKGKYPEINQDMPFSGVAFAFENKTWKPKKTAGVKADIMALMFEKRVKLAYSLKKMDDDIVDLPPITKGEFNESRIMEYLSYYEMDSLKEDIKVLK